MCDHYQHYLISGITPWMQKHTGQTQCREDTLKANRKRKNIPSQGNGNVFSDKCFLLCSLIAVKAPSRPRHYAPVPRTQHRKREQCSTGSFSVCSRTCSVTFCLRSTFLLFVFDDNVPTHWQAGEERKCLKSTWCHTLHCRWGRLSPCKSLLLCIQSRFEQGEAVALNCSINSHPYRTQVKSFNLYNIIKRRFW